jgi:heat shock protein HslJ
LRHGRWEGPPYVAGGASRPGVTLVPGLRITGDLDGDGAPEAVVMLASSGGGSGTFNHVAAASRLANGNVKVRGVAPLGDRVQIRYARIVSGELLIDTVEAGEGDAACCPGTKRLRRWRLTGDTLQEGPVTETGRLGVEDLGGGITWHLSHLDREQTVRAAAPPTLSYASGELSGFAGCNRYFGSVTEGDAPGEISIAPIGITRKACAPDAMTLESEFLRRLGAAEKISFLAGRLALAYRDGDRAGLLMFVAGE